MQSRRHVAGAIVIVATQIFSLVVATDILGADISKYATQSGTIEAVGDEPDIEQADDAEDEGDGWTAFDLTPIPPEETALGPDSAPDQLAVPDAEAEPTEETTPTVVDDPVVVAPNPAETASATEQATSTTGATDTTDTAVAASEVTTTTLASSSTIAAALNEQSSAAPGGSAVAGQVGGNEATTTSTTVAAKSPSSSSSSTTVDDGTAAGRDRSLTTSATSTTTTSSSSIATSTTATSTTTTNTTVPAAPPPTASTPTPSVTATTVPGPTVSKSTTTWLPVTTSTPLTTWTAPTTTIPTTAATTTPSTTRTPVTTQSTTTSPPTTVASTTQPSTAPPTTAPANGSGNSGLEAIRNTDPRFTRYASVPSSGLSLAALTEPSPVKDNGSVGDGQFRAACQYSHFAYDDPIVYPGQSGRSHLHMFFGNTGANAYSTTDSIVNSGGGSCNGFELNRSAYWTPALMDGKGNAVVPDMIILYYKSKEPGQVQAMPQGLKMVSGNTSAESFTANDFLYWSCGDSGHISNKSNRIPNCNGGTVNASIAFPQCWDGRNMDSADHRSHMALVSPHKPCPASHPVRLPQISILLYFQGHPSTQDWYLSSDRSGGFNTGPGATLHADWWGGWNNETMDLWTDGCMKAARNCSFGQTGTDRQLAKLNNFQNYPGPNVLPLP